VSGMRQIADLAEKVIATLASDPQRPEYVQVASSFSPGTAGKGPKLGIMPNYDENKDGVLVGGLADDGPAAKGGLKAGDLIVELGGKAVKNLNTYMVIMAQQRGGQTLEVGVLRDGKKLMLKVLLK
jgi:S1-C subfamily serine protease